MDYKRKNKKLRIISLTLACWGLLLIGSGIAMTKHETTVVQRTYSLSVHQSKVAESKTNEIKLKDMESEINNPISVNIKDYLENSDKIEQNIINALKLDTSKVNIQEAGTYTYTVTYKKKKYNGTFTIKQKELPKLALTLKALKIKKGSQLETSLNTYINQTLTEEIANNITLDLSSVKTDVVGSYQYSVTYNNQLYTSTIEVYEPQTSPVIITPNSDTETKEEPKEEQKQPETPTPDPTTESEQ
ncbi:MAG: hypothetical protein IKH54_04075 [Bacilli bacterium]|nr:hypothetical protein [Bacilli bacterium]